MLNKSKTSIISFPGGFNGEYIVPDTVTSIGESSFAESAGLTDITIPHSVTVISDDAFCECIGLNTVHYNGFVEDWNQINIGINNDSLMSAEIIFAQHVSGVSLNKTELAMDSGESEKLVVTVYPENAYDKSVIWETDDSDVAAVDNNGNVTAINSGNATITVIANDGGFTDSCTVSVTTRVTDISLNKTNLILSVGKQETLAAEIIPDNASNKTVVWSSSDSTVASVDENGTVSALKTGSAIISAVTEDGNYKAECTVTVVTPVSSVSLNKHELILDAGSSEVLTAAVLPADAYDKSVIWASSDETIASVNTNGKVTANKTGTAVITVTTTDGGFTDSCTVSVTTRVTGITLNKNNLVLETGKQETLIVQIVPDDASNKTVFWNSSNNTVATVDENGTVSAIKTGSAVISAISEDGSFTAECTVTVVAAVSSVSLNKHELTLESGTAETLIASILPANAYNKSITWSSSNSAVASVSSIGEVTAVKTGTAVITVTTTDGGYTDTCVVTVFTPVKSVALNKNSLTLKKGSTERLYATVSPSNADNKAVIWTSSNENVATVDSNGNVKGINKGTAVIIVSTKDGGYTDSCNVTVTIPVTSVSLNKKELVLQVGSTETLTASVFPENASNGEVTWKSSSTSIATVDNNGKVKAVKKGTTVIIVTTKDGGYTDTCSLTVVNAFVTSVSLNKNQLKLVPGDSETLTATVSPSNADDKTVTWSTSNENVAMVDNNGKVTAVNAGTATITVTTNEGSHTDNCEVIVAVPVSSVSLNKTELTLEAGKSETLTAVLMPENASNKSVSWASSDESIVIVDENGTVTAVKSGTASITVTCIDGGYTDTCFATVTEPAKTITIVPNAVTLYTGETCSLEIQYDVEYPNQEILSWASNDEKIAVVDQSGIVTAVGYGETEIIVRNEDGRLIANCTVKTKEKVESISFGISSISMYVGEGYALKPIVLPQGAAYSTELTYSSSNSSVATVNSDGIVRALKVGTATITVKNEDGTKKTKTTVSVKERPLEMSDKLLSNVERFKQDMRNKGTTTSSSNVYKYQREYSSGPVDFYKIESSKTTSEFWFVASIKNVTLSGSSFHIYTQYTLYIDAKNGTGKIKDINSSYYKTSYYPHNAECNISNIPTFSLTDPSVYSVSGGLVPSGDPQYDDYCETYKQMSAYTTNVVIGLFNTILKSDFGYSFGMEGLGFATKYADDFSQYYNDTISSITLDKTSITLIPGETCTVSFSFSPSYAVVNNVKWSSSNTNTAQVYGDGEYRVGIKAGNIGTSKVSVQINEKTMGSLTVNVVNPLSIDQEMTVAVGREKLLNPKLYKYSRQDLMWKSDNPDCITIDSNGKIKVLKAGTSTITIQTRDKKYSATCRITAQNMVLVESVSLNKSSLTLKPGNTSTLIATVLPTNAGLKKVIWTSSDESVAKVDQNGKITAVADTGIGEPATAVITATTYDGDYTAECAVTVEDPINAFVRRLYRLCFNRTADKGGFTQWSSGLRSGKNTAAKTVQFFFTSKEYKNLNLSNEDFVEMCYQVMMGRASDTGGKKNWLSKLDAGVSDLYVLKGFVGSKEFAKICKDYGITVGTINLTEARDQNLGITQFVSRCYSEVLGRKADTGGLNTWCNKILTASDKKQAAIDMASNGFFHSTEFKNKNTTNAQYVTILYKTFFGRNPDTGGYNNWMNKLKSGTSRDTVLMGFANSAEFANIMAKYGIK